MFHNCSRPRRLVALGVCRGRRESTAILQEAAAFQAAVAQAFPGMGPPSPRGTLRPPPAPTPCTSSPPRHSPPRLATTDAATTHHGLRARFCRRDSPAVFRFRLGRGSGGGGCGNGGGAGVDGGGRWCHQATAAAEEETRVRRRLRRPPLRLRPPPRALPPQSWPKKAGREAHREPRCMQCRPALGSPPPPVPAPRASPHRDTARHCSPPRTPPTPTAACALVFVGVILPPGFASGSAVVSGGGGGGGGSGGGRWCHQGPVLVRCTPPPLAAHQPANTHRAS